MPIDPDAHFALITRLLCWTYGSHLIASAGAVGLLVALLVYLWRDVLQMIRSLARVLGASATPRRR